ncbi:MAG: phosphotransferase [Candidatus Uhrbacteria bacterium]|nr:phosphotransferase [Candidatus Uhrbacteria bacterium]
MAFHNGRMNRVILLGNDRVQKTATRVELSRPCRLKVEHWALTQAKQRNLPVPTPLRHFIDAHGYECLVTSHIAGTPLSLCSRDSKRKGYATIGPHMLKLGGVIEGFGWISPNEWKGEFETWQSFLQHFHQRYGIRLASQGILTHGHVSSVERAIEKLEQPVESFLLHRDLKPANILRDNKNGFWILDWENSILGDPLFDVACFGANHGHGYCWEELRKSYGLPIDHLAYLVYEILAFMGIICFNLQHNKPIERRTASLIRCLAQLNALSAH